MFSSGQFYSDDLSTFSHRRDHMQHDADRPSAAAGDGDQVGVSAKRRNVPLHPLERCHLVLHAVVTRGVGVACAHEPWKIRYRSIKKTVILVRGLGVKKMKS